MREKTTNKPREQKEDALERVVSVDRISRTVAGGRRIRFRALIVVGEDDNKVGIGLAKANDNQTAIQKARRVAKKHMISVPVVRGTIPRQVEMVFGSTKVILKPAPEGHSVIAGGTVRNVVELAGITNLVSKIIGSSSKINGTMATYLALKKLSTTAKI